MPLFENCQARAINFRLCNRRARLRFSTLGSPTLNEWFPCPMSFHRKPSEDRSQTVRVIAGVRRPADSNDIRRNWLGHYVAAGTGLVDAALLEGASLETLKQYRGAIPEHLRHLREEHGLVITERDGVYRFCPNQH
jgi:hypothetical protein